LTSLQNLLAGGWDLIVPAASTVVFCLGLNGADSSTGNRGDSIPN